MKQEFKDELDQIFVKREEKVQRAQQEQAERQRRVDQFRQDFMGVAESLIKPTFDSIAAQLGTKGIRATVAVNDGADDGDTSPSVTLHFAFPDDERLGRSTSYHVHHDQPRFQIKADVPRLQVLVFENTMRAGRGGQSGVVTSPNLAELTEDVITQLVLKTIRKMM